MTERWRIPEPATSRTARADLDGAITNAGLLEATSGGTLTIGGNVGNAGGTILAGVGGEVDIDNVTVNNTGGIVEDLGLNSNLDISGSTIEGGTLSTGPVIQNGSGNTIEVRADSGVATSVFDGSASAVTIAGDVVVAGGADLELIGTIHIDGANGQLQVGQPGNNSPPGDASLVIDGSVTLDGGNQISLWSTTTQSGQVVAAAGGGTLDNIADRIYGSGTVGNGDGMLTLINESGGAIDAAAGSVNSTATTGVLVLNTGNTIDNKGLFEATGLGALIIDDALDNTNSGRVAVTGGSYVDIESSTVTNETGGSITSDGAIDTTFNIGTSELQIDSVSDAGTLSNSGTIAATNGGIVDIESTTVTNAADANITADGGFSSTDFQTVSEIDIDTNNIGAALSNSGTITASNGGFFDIESGTITNTPDGIIKADGGLSGVASTVDFGDSNVDSTLSNSGSIVASASGVVVIGSSSVTNTNTGTLSADGVGSDLTLSSADLPRDHVVVANNGGTVEALNDATVELYASTIDNTDAGLNDGTVEAVNGAHVFLYDGSEIVGGTVSTSDGGLIEIAMAPGNDGAAVVTFDGSQTSSDGNTPLQVTIDGAVQVDDDTTLTLRGTIGNSPARSTCRTTGRSHSTTLLWKIPARYRSMPRVRARLTQPTS